MLMEVWEKRAPEIAYLYNPAFCGKILHCAIKGYQNKKTSMPYPLIYFVLPLIFKPQIFEDIAYTRKSFSSWFQNKPDLLNDFAERIIDFKQIKKEGLLFLAKLGLIKIINGELLIIETSNKISEVELKKYFEKSEKIGNFLALCGDAYNVFITMGVNI